jgi:hypothetical protein
VTTRRPAAFADAEPAPGVATHLADMLSRPYGADEEIAEPVGDRDRLLVVDGCAGRRPARAEGRGGWANREAIA